MKINEKLFKLSIGNKIFIGFSILIIIYMGMALSSYSDMVEIRTLSEQAVPLSSQLNSLQEFAISTEVLEKDLDSFFIVNNKDNQEEANKDFEKMYSIISSLEKNATNNSITEFQEMGRILHEININFNGIANLKNNRSGEDNEKRILIYELINNVRQKNRELLSGTTDKIQANFRNQQMVIYEHI